MNAVRIAVVHSVYSSQQPSGENRVVEDQIRALREAGHDVAVIERRTEDLQSQVTYPVRTAFRVATRFGTSPLRELQEFAPDVVHVHNLFPNFGSRWMEAWPGPVVMTLHNFRLVCSNGYLYRDNQVCTECPQFSDWRAVRHGCYRESRFASIPVALSRKGSVRDVLNGVSALVTTSRAFDRTLRANWPHSLETVLIPNFGWGQPRQPAKRSYRHGWLAMGRFSAEKGFGELLEIWPEHQPLTLIGDGPDADCLEAQSQGLPVSLQASVPIETLREMIPRFQGLVFPSRWIEGAPQVVVEAARVGLPIVTLNSNGVADLVADYGSGAIYSDGESLRVALNEVQVHLEDMSEASVAMFRELWDREKWLQRTEGLYSSLV